jgi:hypothetical protein
MSERARHLDAAFLFQSEPERERRTDESIGILFVCIIRARESWKFKEFFFLSSFPVFYLFGFLCKKVTLFGNGQQQQQQQQLTASSHFCVVLLSSSSESQLSGWQALFSTSIITVPFICLPLRCQVHPDLSSLRQRPAAAYLKNPAR